MTNTAVWLPAKCEAFKLGLADIPTPGPESLVITTASPQSHTTLKDLGTVEVIDHHLSALLSNHSSHGPFHAIFDVSGSSSQSLITSLLSSQGGGAFITTMPISPSISLAANVEGKFVQYADDYLKPENEEYAKWVFWTYVEEGFRDEGLEMGGLEVIEGWIKWVRDWDGWRRVR